MKTTKRSKMLLSSIAMLLVALVALGSATYAWYVVNTQVTASSTTLSAAAAEGLVIKNENTGAINTWGNAITLTEAGQALDPVSLGLKTASVTPATLTGVKYQGTALDDGTASGSATAIAAADLSTYVVKEDFYVAFTGTGTKAVKLQNTTAAAAGSYEVAAIFVNDTYVGAFNSDGTDSTTDKVNSQSVALTDANTDLAIGNVGNTPVKITVVAFVDGENTNCKNSTAYTTDYSFAFKAYY